MHVLVTGAAGFVGGHLVASLERQRFRVTQTDREVDVTDGDAIRRCLRTSRPTAIVHLAAQSSVAASIQRPHETYRLNYVGSLQLLAAVEDETPDARVLLVGSSDCYGPPMAIGARPIREDAPLRPQNPYSCSKAAAEILGDDAAQRGLDVVRVRSFTHIGPGQTDRFVASSFARQIVEIEAGRREPRLAVGNLDSVRDFLDVRDVVRAYARLLEPGVPADTYNVCSGTGVPIQSLLDQLLALAGVQAEVVVDPARYREADYQVGDSSRLRSATGWQPQIPLRDTLAELLDWWRAEIDRDRS